MLRILHPKFWAKKFPLAKTIGPKDFRGETEGWEGQGVLSKFDDVHGLDILVADQTEDTNEENFGKTWATDADEVLFRRGKRIMLYWRKK